MKPFLILLTLLFPFIASADLNFTMGDGFYIPGINDSNFVVDPDTGNFVPVGSAVYLILDTDCDGSAGDFDPATGLPINGDILVATTTSYSVGQGSGLAGSFISSAAFGDLNTALTAAGVTSGKIYARVFNVPDPANAPMGIYSYGDSIDPAVGGNTDIADETSPLGTVAGYYQYDQVELPSGAQPSWTLPIIDLQRVPEPSTLAFFGIGLAGFFFMRRRARKEDS